MDNISQIERLVQKGGNMYLEKFESFEEKQSSLAASNELSNNKPQTVNEEEKK